uniref:Uncharacterized protein n=1 Tax=Romanomermis culicivorax TaxID=13658 RepID=A0A915KRW1_ROMCU
MLDNFPGSSRAIPPLASVRVGVTIPKVWVANRFLGATMRSRVQPPVLKGFVAGTRAIPPLANVRVGITIPTRAQEKGLGCEPIPWSNNEVPGTATSVEGLCGWHRSRLTTGQ